MPRETYRADSVGFHFGCHYRSHGRALLSWDIRDRPASPLSQVTRLRPRAPRPKPFACVLAALQIGPRSVCPRSHCPCASGVANARVDFFVSCWKIRWPAGNGDIRRPPTPPPRRPNPTDPEDAADLGNPQGYQARRARSQPPPWRTEHRFRFDSC
jgi:hypothetical protein